MIKKEELKLGNLVNYESTTHVITGLLDEVCISEWTKAEEEDPYTHPYSQIKGIELTEDIVNKIPEFEKFATWYTNLWIELQVQENRIHVRIVTGPSSKFLRYIKYVHELQNLYFSLSEKSLTIKL